MSDKQNILYVLLDKWADWEYAFAAGAVAYLGEDKYRNIVVSTDTNIKQSMCGLRCLPDCDLENVPTKYAAVVLIGGLSWRGGDAEKVMPLVRQCLEKGTPLGAICDACRFLAGMGVLNNIKHTGNGASELNEAGDGYKNPQGFVAEQAVRDKGIITANGTAALEFARELCLALGLNEKQIETWYTCYKRGFFSSG